MPSLLGYRHLVLLGLLGTCFLGCAESADGRVVRGARGAIVAGEAVSGPPYDAVGSVHLGAIRRLACSATLITPDAMVTAAHCVQGWPADEIAVQFQMSALGAHDGDFRYLTETVIHPDYDGSEPNDLAVLLLAEAVTDITPLEPLPQSLVFDTTDVNALQLDIVGFGADQEGEIGTRHSKLLMLGGLGCRVAGCPSSLQDDPALVSYAQQDGGPCALDSGGPALVERGGQLYLGAVTVDGDTACEQWGVSVSIAPFVEWIEGVAGEYDAPPPSDASVPADAGATIDAGVGDAPGIDSGSATGSCSVSRVPNRAWLAAVMFVLIAVGRRRYSSTRT